MKIDSRPLFFLLTKMTACVIISLICVGCDGGHDNSAPGATPSSVSETRETKDVDGNAGERPKQEIMHMISEANKITFDFSTTLTTVEVADRPAIEAVVSLFNSNNIEQSKSPEHAIEVFARLAFFDDNNRLATINVFVDGFYFRLGDQYYRFRHNVLNSGILVDIQHRGEQQN